MERLAGSPWLESEAPVGEKHERGATHGEDVGALVDQGAAAVLGASTLTRSSSDRALGELVMSRLSQPGMNLGRALVEAKQELAASNPQMIDVLLGWTLLGDPALGIDWPISDPLLSEKDRSHPPLRDLPQYFTYKPIINE